MVHQIESSDFSPLGLMPKSWSMVKLKEITSKIGSGATPKGGEKAYLKIRHNYALIRSQNVFDRRFDEDGLAFISDAQAIELKNVVIQPGDLLLNITGDGITFARACLAPTHVLPACVNQHVTIIRCNPVLCLPEYLLAYLTHPDIKAYIESFNAGGSRRAITKGHIESFVIPLPSLDEQRAIAGILGTLDAKIEVNRRMNATLESLAWAVFRQWFVVNEEEITWQEKSLDEIAGFLNGLALQKFPPSENDFLPVIKISQLRKNDTVGADKANINIPTEYIIEDGDILFSWSGSLEVVIWGGGKGALNQHLFKVTSEKYPKWFYYFWTKYHLPEFQEIAAGKATTMGHIQRHHLKAAKVLVPSDQELKEMGKVMSPLLDKIIINNLEMRTLASLRDSLLPKLMRGEVRLKDVEREL